jgi:hypothetical protein
MQTIGVLENSVELLFAAAGGSQLYPVTKPRSCVAPVLDFEELSDDAAVVLGISGGRLLVPITLLKIDRF